MPGRIVGQTLSDVQGLVDAVLAAVGCMCSHRESSPLSVGLAVGADLERRRVFYLTG